MEKIPLSIQMLLLENSCTLNYETKYMGFVLRHPSGISELVATKNITEKKLTAIVERFIELTRRI